MKFKIGDIVIAKETHDGMKPTGKGIVSAEYSSCGSRGVKVAFIEWKDEGNSASNTLIKNAPHWNYAERDFHKLEKVGHVSITEIKKLNAEIQMANIKFLKRLVKEK